MNKTFHIKHRGSGYFWCGKMPKKDEGCWANIDAIAYDRWYGPEGYNTCNVCLEIVMGLLRESIPLDCNEYHL